MKKDIFDPVVFWFFVVVVESGLLPEQPSLGRRRGCLAALLRGLGWFKDLEKVVAALLLNHPSSDAILHCPTNVKLRVASAALGKLLRLVDPGVHCVVDVADLHSCGDMVSNFVLPLKTCSTRQAVVYGARS
jgi:hypothetical protein